MLWDTVSVPLTAGVSCVDRVFVAQLGKNKK